MRRLLIVLLEYSGLAWALEELRPPAPAAAELGPDPWLGLEVLVDQVKRRRP